MTVDEMIEKLEEIEWYFWEQATQDTIIAALRAAQLMRKDMNNITTHQGQRHISSMPGAQAWDEVTKKAFRIGEDSGTVD